MWSLLTGLISPITEWVKGSNEIKKAKVEREVKALTHEADWNTVQAEASKGSWKDEFWTIVFSIPLILCFFPDMVPHVTAGFIALDNTPDWYQQCLLALVAASVGLRSIMKFKK